MENKSTSPTTIFKLSEVPEEWNGMPSDDIDPDLKKGDFCLKWAQFIYSMFYNGQCYTTFDKLRKYEELRAYGSGNQSKERYMDILLGALKPQDGGVRKGWMNVNWDVWSPASKFVRLILGRLEQQDYNVTANAIDPQSGSEREDMKWASWYEARYGLQQLKIKQTVGIPTNSKVRYVPESIEELEMYSTMGGFKLKKEIDIEKALNYTSHLSNEKQIRRKVNADFIKINIGSYKDIYDKLSKKVKYEYMDPATCIFDYSTEEDFSNMRFWGQQKLYSITRLRAEGGYSEEELRGYAIQFAGMYGNNSSSYIDQFRMWEYKNKDGVYVYNRFKIPVLCCEWTSLDKKYKTKRKIELGEVYNKNEYGKIYDTENRKTEVTESQNVYTCNWIIGSKMVFNDGPLDVVPREQISKAAKMSAHVYALPGQSIIESITHNLDQLQLANLKLQNALANAAPNGLKIEFGSLSNINLGDGNMSPLELVKLYRHTGNIIYKATTHAGKYNNYANPIEKIEGGIGESLNEFVRIFELNLSQIAEASGIDRVSGVSPKPGEVTATEVNKAGAATEDALQPLFYGWTNMKESAAKNAAYRIQTIVKHVPGAAEGYYHILGDATIEEFKLSPDISAADYGINIEARPTQQEIMQTMADAKEALKPGKDGEQISFGEYLLVLQMLRNGQVKHAIAVLNFRLDKRKSEALQKQQENIELQNKGAQETEKIKIEGELEKIRMKAKEERETEFVKAILTLHAGEDAHIKELQKMVLDNYMEQKKAEQAALQGAKPIAA